MKDAINSLLNGIAILDSEGNITYANSSFLKMWGYDSSEEILGRSNIEFWNDEKQYHEILNILKAENNWISDVIGIRKNGTKFKVQISASMVLDDSGNTNQMIGSFIDRTNQNQIDRTEVELVKTIKEREILIR